MMQKSSFSTLLVRTMALTILLVGVIGGSSAFAAQSPWWHLTADTRPASLTPGGEGSIIVRSSNLGDEVTSGTTVLTDRLPAGVTAESVTFFASTAALERGSVNLAEFLPCPVTPQKVTCEFPLSLYSYEDLEMVIKVKVASSVTLGGSNEEAEVSGGGAPPVSVKQSLPLAGGEPAFGLQRFELTPEEEGGEPDTQAGSHPFQLTATIGLNTGPEPSSPGASREIEEPALPRNLEFKLPAGFVGNAQAVPRCSIADFDQIISAGVSNNNCASDTAIGVASVTIDEPRNLGLKTIPVPLFNLTPEKGEPARFGFELLKVPVTLDTSVRTGSDYGVTVKVSNISQAATFVGSQVTFWGVPGDPRHDQARGWNCFVGGTYGVEGACQPLDQSNPPPFLTLPTACGEPFQSSVQASSWPNKADPAGFSDALVSTLEDGSGHALSLTGCNQLAFNPSIGVTPDGQQGSTRRLVATSR
jgi:hypothetical protein